MRHGITAIGSGGSGSRVDPHLVDALLGLLFTSVSLVILLARDAPAPPLRADDALGIALVLLTTAPLAVLRFQPLLAYAVMLSATLASAILGYSAPVTTTIVLIVALFMITLATTYRRAIAAAVMSGIVSIAAIFLGAGTIDVGTTIVLYFVFSAVWVLALLLRVYRESAGEARERAALFAADREARAREAVADERARLARELHDVVGHALNVVVIQAGAGQRVLQKRPELAAQALASIEAAGRQALLDVERMLGILRSERQEGESRQAPPGMGRLPELVEQVGRAGLPVQLIIRGQKASLPASLDLSAYRLVQEALTNSLKHAGRARATVLLDFRDDAVEIEVTDDGRSPPASEEALQGGRGIPGMRERVAVFGGRIEVGPQPEGGFRVWARLPLREEER